MKTIRNVLGFSAIVCGFYLLSASYYGDGVLAIALGCSIIYGFVFLG